MIMVVLGCREKTSKTARHSALETEEITFRKDGEIHIYGADGQERVTLNIEVAKSDYEQETGLMYRKGMRPNEGMLFVYDDERPRPNFYMKNTYMALDLLYINADNEIVDSNKNAQPLNEDALPSEAPAQYVLEVNAGIIDKFGIQNGDRVKIRL